MKIEETAEAGRTILKLQGKLIIGETDALRDKVNEVVQAGKVQIALDVADVPYMDSAGLGEITRCYTAVGRANGQLKLVNIPRKIRDLLTVTRLLDILEDRS
jgi:anti-sigma B factor antagonist